jgi:ESCRT-II complex subunit VPS25
MIYDWVTENGLTGSIMTFYEITDGDLSFSTGTSPLTQFNNQYQVRRGAADKTEFREMPPSLLRKSLDTLVKRGKAQVLKGEGEAGEGVRFL